MEFVAVFYLVFMLLLGFSWLIMVRPPKFFEDVRDKGLFELFSGKKINLLVLLVLIGVVLRLTSAGFIMVSDQPFYMYASKQVFLGHRPYEDFFFSQPPFDLYLTAVMFKLFGLGVVQAKIAPLVFSILSIPLVYLLSLKLSGDTRGGLFSAVLFALSPLLILFSPANILYSTLLFTTALSSYLFVVGTERENRWLLFSAGLSASIGFWSRFFGILVLLAEVFFLAVYRKDCSSKLFAPLLSGFIAASVIMVCLFYSPAFIYQVFIHHLFFLDCPPVGKVLFLILTMLLDPLVFFFGFSGLFACMGPKENRFYRLFVIYIGLSFSAILVMRHACVMGAYTTYSMLLVMPLSVLGGRALGNLKIGSVLLLALVLAFMAAEVATVLNQEVQDSRLLEDAVVYVSGNSGAGCSLVGDPFIAPSIAFLSDCEIPLDGIEFDHNRFTANGSKEFFREIAENVTYFVVYSADSGNTTAAFSRGLNDFLVNRQGYSPPIDMRDCNNFVEVPCVLEKMMGGVKIYRLERKEFDGSIGG